MQHDNVLFVRGSKGEKNQENGSDDANDVWDDTLLIKAYDKAIKLAKEEVAKRLSTSTNAINRNTKKFQFFEQPQHEKNTQKKWTVGAPCRAVYSVDGEMYEAIITKMFYDTKKCLVKFIGYENVEKVDLSSLCESDGLESQIAQRQNSEAEKSSKSAEETVYNHQNNYEEVNKHNPPDENMDYDTSPNFDYSYKSEIPFRSDFGTPPPPPLPPQMMARLPENDADALSSMLMSWYISGFHTGYYHGLKHLQKSLDNQKKKLNQS